MKDTLRRSSENCAGGCHQTPPYAIEVLEASPSHMPWVFKSWLESYHRNGIDMRGVRMGEYSAMMTARMQRLVSRSRVFVAVDPDDTDHLYAFAVIEMREVPVVHFAYTKATRREHGVAATVLRHAFKRVCGDDAPGEWHFSHATFVGKHIATRKHHGGRHNVAAAWDEMRRAG